jgi:hypothetical protein
MAVRHRDQPVDGVPSSTRESVLTPVGHDLCRNFLRAMIQQALGQAARRSLARPRRSREQSWTRSWRGGDAGPDRRLLVALRLKGETPDEIAGFAEAIRARGVSGRAHARRSRRHGGHRRRRPGTINISTAAALVRPRPARLSPSTATAVSSASGSADVLEALGFSLELPPERIEASIDELGFGFLFAPTHHPDSGTLRRCARSWRRGRVQRARAR